MSKKDSLGMKVILLVLWALTLALNIEIRSQFCQISCWSWDQSSLLWQAVNFLKDGAFPWNGIVSSTGTITFNTATLLTTLLAFFFESVSSISFALSILQVITTLLLLSAISELTGLQRWCIGSAILFNPYVIAISLDNWPQFMTGNLICLVLVLVFHLYKVKKASLKFWFIFGLLLSITFTAYLGHVALAFSLSIILTVSRFQNRIYFYRKELVAMFVGTLPVIGVVLIPYLINLWDTGHLRQFVDHDYQARPRNWEHFFLALTHPWRLLFDPRDFYWYSNMKVISEQTNSGLFSFYSLLCLQIGCLIVALGGILGSFFKNSWRINLLQSPLTHENIRLIATIWTLVLCFFFILPSSVFYADHKGAAWTIPGFILLYVGAISATRLLSWRWHHVDVLIFGSLIISCYLLNKRIIHDHTNYQGTYVPFIDAPLKDRIEAIDHIAKQSKDKKNIGIAYDFSFGNRTQLEEEYRFYAIFYPNTGLETGRLYDAQLLLKHGIHNSNIRVSDRHLGDNEFLITYSFVQPEDLRSPWANETDLKDFGRIRVYQRKLKNE